VAADRRRRARPACAPDDRHPGSCPAPPSAGIGIGAIADYDRIEAYVEQGRLFRPEAAEVER
jgi:hypothetical protein